jgi:hypothetical protein
MVTLNRSRRLQREKDDQSYMKLVTPEDSFQFPVSGSDGYRIQGYGIGDSKLELETGN